MIIKDYFADGLLQIAIVLSLLRSDLDNSLDTLVRPMLVRSRLLEINDGPLSGITQTDLNFYSRGFVRPYPKVLDSYSDRFSSVLRDLHSLSYYRRFDGISTNVHAWLVNDGGPDGSASSCEHSPGDNADEANATSQHVSCPPTAGEISVVASETNNMNLFVEDELSKEDMELINILYLQDIDLGISREDFDDLCSDVTVSAVAQKECDLKQPLLTEDDGQCDSATNSAQQSVDNCHLRPQYVVDTETGELVLTSSSAVSETLDVHYDQHSFSQSNHDNRLIHDIADLQLEDGSHYDDQQNYDRQSSYEERWEDMLSILDIQSVLEGDTVPEVTAADWDSFNSEHSASPSLALMHNVSMTQPIVSSSSILSHSDLAAMPPPMSYDLVTMTNDSLSLFQSNDFHVSPSSDFDIPSNISLTCETALLSNGSKFAVTNSSCADVTDDENYRFVSDVSDDAIPSHRAAQAMPDDFDCSTTLSTTVEHYSSAAAALNDDDLTHHVNSRDELCAAESECVASGSDLSPTNSNVTDTNALFHQLLCTNFLLDELSFDNITLLDRNVTAYDNWSSGDSAVSSMHSPTLESAVDVPAGASGFKDDVSPEHSVTTTSCSDNYDTGEFYYLARECGVRTSSNASSSNNSRHSSTSSGVDQQNVQHNHTYPLAPGQRSRSEREKEAQQDRDERASRSRDEKKAKDMQIPLTMEEMIDSSVEEFNELLTKYKLSDAQHQLIRDIRRRGKNKLAAQNCRKRKLEVIQAVEDELLELHRERDKLLQEKQTLDRRSASLKQKFSLLEVELFRRLHNETGQEYDPQRFSVLQTDDGRVFIVPRDTSTNQPTREEQNKRKRKPDKKD